MQFDSSMPWPRSTDASLNRSASESRHPREDAHQACPEAPSLLSLVRRPVFSSRRGQSLEESIASSFDGPEKRFLVVLADVARGVAGGAAVPAELNSPQRKLVRRTRDLRARRQPGGSRLPWKEAAR